MDIRFSQNKDSPLYKEMHAQKWLRKHCAEGYNIQPLF